MHTSANKRSPQGYLLADNRLLLCLLDEAEKYRKSGEPYAWVTCILSIFLMIGLVSALLIYTSLNVTVTILVGPFSFIGIFYGFLSLRLALMKPRLMKLICYRKDICRFTFDQFRIYSYWGTKKSRSILNRKFRERGRYDWGWDDKYMYENPGWVFAKYFNRYDVTFIKTPPAILDYLEGRTESIES